MGDERNEGLSRRAFLKVAGTVGVAAGCSGKAEPQKLIPYLVPPENIVPGTPLFYRTVCRECPAGCGVTARTREGRVVKLEGNPEDPIGRGALCARGQAAPQGLYATDRLHGPMRRGADGQLAPVSWDEAMGLLTQALSASQVKGAAGLRMLTRPEAGSAGALQRELFAKLGARPEQRVVLEPFDLMPLRAAGELLYGKRELPAYALGAARSVVSFGADFLETWLSPVELTRDFAAGRGKVGEERTRLTSIGPRLSLTAASADTFLAVRPGGELWVALGLLHWLLDPSHGVKDLAPEAHAVLQLVTELNPEEIARQSGISYADVERLGRELAYRRPSALLGPGVSSVGPQATELAVTVQLINHVLGNVGRTVLYGLDPLEDLPSSFAAMKGLVADMASGKVEVLLVHHADPVGALPAALGAAEALGRVPLVVSFSDRVDATTEHAHLVLPDHHPLESFGDVSPRRGVVAFSQPAMTPLGDTRSTSQVLLDAAAKLPTARFPVQDFYEYVQVRTRVLAASSPSEDATLFLRTAQECGGVYSEAKPETVSLRVGGLAPLLPAPADRGGEALPLLVFPTLLRHDGRGAHQPWLREVPDAVTTISWSGWAELSPKTAARMGIAEGELLALTTPSGRAELPAHIYPGLSDEVVALPLGGREALALLPAAVDVGSGALAWQSSRATVARTGRQVALPRVEQEPYKEPGELLPTVSTLAPAVPRPVEAQTMYEPPEHPKHRWAMAIDLDRCTGCQACVVACYAENNVPIMGPEAAVTGRNMAWLRIERYFEKEAPQPRMSFLPMLCQQCDSAPCESVCPVYATYHTKEGLNAQVYNRCVGTRYCSNNCPYKVRLFNWKDPEFPAPLNMQLNPDVSVRSKGVMEKCTFCVQRIRYSENAARDEQREVRDGEVTSACAQTCPAQAIVFGDAHDPDSRVARLQRDPRAFHALEDLNTRPAIAYLARVVEKKP